MTRSMLPLFSASPNEVMKGAAPVGCGTLPSSRMGLFPCA